MHKLFLAPVLALVVVISGCASTGQQNGTLLGGAVGGLIGSQFGSGTGKLVATGLGVAVGMVIGGDIGRQMDANDIRTTGQILETGKTGRPSKWTNPDSGRTYEATPTKTFQLSTGKYCREFIIRDATVAGSNQQVYGTACRQPDGTWQMVQR